MLRVNDLAISVANQLLLRDLSFDVAQHECVAIIGENGCGKSTLLKTLIGVQTAESGEVWLAEKAINQHEPKSIAKRMAMVNQFNQCNFAFYVEDILLLARQNRLESHATSISIVETMSSLLNIKHLYGKNIQMLSGGERQRVFIAKALIQLVGENCSSISQIYESLRGKLLVMDEPTSALDLRHRSSVMEELVAFCQIGLGILIVSHDVNLMSRFANRIIFLGNKQIIADGPPKEVITPPVLETCFGISPEILIDSENCPIIVQ